MTTPGPTTNHKRWTQNDAKFWRAVRRGIERGGLIKGSPLSTLRWKQTRAALGLCDHLRCVYDGTNMSEKQLLRLWAALVRMCKATNKLDTPYWTTLDAVGDKRRIQLCFALEMDAQEHGGNHID